MDRLELSEFGWVGQDDRVGAELGVSMAVHRCSGFGRWAVAQGLGDELASGGGTEFFVQVFDMVVHGVGAASEVGSDHAHGVSQDELIEDFVFAIGEPGFGVGDLLEGEVGLVGDQREQFREDLEGEAGWFGARSRRAIALVRCQGDDEHKAGELWGDRDDREDGVGQMLGGEDSPDGGA